MKLRLIVVVVSLFLFAGCASVPLTSPQLTKQAQAFPKPDPGMAGLYVFRDQFMGAGVKFDVLVDGKCLGQTAQYMFFYTQVKGDQKHTLTTESEFTPNHLTLYFQTSKNYFIRQRLHMGAIYAWATLKNVGTTDGKHEILKLHRAVTGQCEDLVPAEVNE